MIAVALGIGSAALLLVVTILLILDARLTVSPRVIEGLVHAWQALFADETQPCPHCGADGRVLGTKGTTRWWYCPTCNGNPWREHAAPRQAVSA